jgi:hypothetical protein
MAKVRQMAKQMGVSVDRAEKLADRASALNDHAGFDKGGMNDKFAVVMKEFKDGTLRSGGSGKIVTDPDQAKAIAASYEKGGIIRGTRAQVRGRKFSGVY